MVRYLPLVKYAALRIAGRVGDHVEVDDLYQSGTIGLREAIASFDPSRGVKFETYCTLRIRGAMFDGLKPLDPLPREVRRAVHAINDAARSYRVEHGREPEITDLARMTGHTQELCKRCLRAAKDTTLTSLFEPQDANDARPIDQLVDPHAAEPSDEAENQDTKQLLLRGLSRQERLIITLYYYEELTMQEIGQVLGVTTTRICQIHGEIIARLRGRLKARDQAEKLLAGHI
jgi:RNA polymerase sigma factor for flagellar operon FliA